MDEDLQSASASMPIENHKPAYSPKTSKQRRGFPKTLFIMFLLLIIVAMGGFAAWKLLLNKPKVTPVVATPVAVVPIVKNDVPNEPLNQTYTSSKLSVAFKYPFGWKVSEANDGVRIESPAFTYNALNAGDIAGNFRIYVRQGARTTDGKYIGSGVAVKPSEKLIYTQPAIGQRTDTLLSIFGFNDSANFSFFLIAGNFQLQKEQTLGPDYGKEADTYIIAGGYSMPAAIDDLATTPVSLNYYDTTNAYKQAIATIASLQLK